MVGDNFLSVACLQPPPPLRKNRRRGDFFLEEGAAVQCDGSPVNVAFRLVSVLNVLLIQGPYQFILSSVASVLIAKRA